jgi:hypothetical protein
MILVAVSSLALLGCGGGGGGGGNGGGTAASALFVARIADYKATYGKDDAWEDWMLANASRYQAVFDTSRAKPSTISIAWNYEGTPVPYSPAWTDENEHMTVFNTMAVGAFIGYNFDFQFGGNTSTSYANVIAGTVGTTSYQLGKNVYLHWETIFNHEFGHVMGVLHHYDTNDRIGDGDHMPPGETTCIMDRNSTLFCSACRTALGIPLDVMDTTAMDAAMSDILSRYPSGWKATYPTDDPVVSEKITPCGGGFPVAGGR